MPFYEILLTFKTLPKPQLVQAIKQVADVMLDQKAVIHTMEFLGHKPFSARMNKEGQAYLDGSFFVINFHSPSSLLPQLHDHLTRDMNVLRNRVVRKEVEVYRPCERQACDFGELTDEMRRRDRDLQQLCIKKL